MSQDGAVKELTITVLKTKSARLRQTMFLRNCAAARVHQHTGPQDTGHKTNGLTSEG